jgi:hypothetical protein
MVAATQAAPGETEDRNGRNSPIGGVGRRRCYVLKVDIGGIAGVVAPIIGKQPPDSLDPR